MRVSRSYHHMLQGTRRSIVQHTRKAAWRILGAPPARFMPVPIPKAVSSAANPKSGGPTSAWRELRSVGFRAERGLELYGTKSITIRYEPPVQINRGTLALYRNLRIGAYSFCRTGRVRHVESIGRYTSVGPGVILGESEHPVDWLSTTPAVFNLGHYGYYPPEKQAAAQRVIARTSQNSASSKGGRVTVGNDVWIGANAIIRRGVHIGDGAIVGAGAFVNRDVAPYTIVGGVPARPIGTRFADEVISELLDLKWWEFDINDLAGVDFSDVRAAIGDIRRREQQRRIHRWAPPMNSVTLTPSGYKDLVTPTAASSAA